MPARCVTGFFFEDDLISASLHGSVAGLDESSARRKRGALRSLEKRWQIHCETCPFCSRRDTSEEATIRHNYESKRAEYHVALRSDVARIPTAGLSLSAMRQSGVSSYLTRRLLSELETLRHRLL